MMGLGLGFAFSPTAQAVACEHRSEAHQLEHGGFTADNAWHVLHGDLPTCKVESNSNSSRKDGDVSQDEGKSRFCRKRWFC